MPSILGTPLPRETILWIVAAVFAGIALLVFLAPRLRKAPTEVIHVDETGVSREGGGIREHIRWADVVEIQIITTDEGPYSEDVFFALADGKGRGCLIPHDAAVRTRLLEQLQARFPGLDDAKVIEAMGSTTNNNFLIWKREGLQ